MFRLSAFLCTALAIAAIVLLACTPAREPGIAAPASTTSATAEPDPVLVQQLPGSGRAARYGDTEAFDACSLLPVAELGMGLRPQSTLLHNYLDGDVPADLAVEQDLMASISFCDYTLTNNNRVAVGVHQAPYLAADELADMARRHLEDSAVREEHGLTIGVSEDDDFRWFYVSRPGLLVVGGVETQRSAEFGPLDAEAFTDKVSSTVARNVAKGPAAPMRHVYGAPFANVAPACEIASASAFTKSYPAASASIVQAQYYLGAKEFEGALQSLTSCNRTNVVRGGTLNKQDHRRISVGMDLWDNPEAAAGGNTYSCDPTERHAYGPPVAVEPSIGAGKTCLSSLSNDWALEFHVGGVVVTMTTGSREQTSPDERRAQLLPAGRAVAEALAK